MGQALRILKSTDVRYVVGHGNQVPTGVTAWKPGAGGNHLIKSIVIEGSGSKPIKWRDALVGFFEDDQGEDYLMLTNLWHDEGVAASQRSMKVTLKLQPGVTSIGRLSRETGKPELLAVKGDTFELTLPGGTGDLLRLGSAKFPGLEQDE